MIAVSRCFSLASCTPATTAPSSAAPCHIPLSTWPSTSSHFSPVCSAAFAASASAAGIAAAQNLRLAGAADGDVAFAATRGASERNDRMLRASMLSRRPPANQGELTVCTRARLWLQLHAQKALRAAQKNSDAMLRTPTRTPTRRSASRRVAELDDEFGELPEGLRHLVGPPTPSPRKSSARRSLTRPRTLSTGRRFPAVLPEELVAEVAGRLGAAALGFACVSKATARVLTSHEHVWRDAYIGAFGEDELADELPPSMWHACLKHAQRA